MLYNETIATTTSYSPDGSTIGYTVRITSYPFDILVLLGNVGLFLLIVFYIKGRRKKI